MVDMASRPHYNTPARLGCRLITSMVTAHGLRYAKHTTLSLLLLSASSAAVPPRLRPFFCEAANPHPRLICLLRGGASPVVHAHSMPTDAHPRVGAGVTEPKGELPMETPYPTRRTVQRLSRRGLLQAGLAAGVTLSTWPLSRPSTLWGAESGTAQARRHPACAGVGTTAL